MSLWAEASKATKEVPFSTFKQRGTSKVSFARLEQQRASYKTDWRKGSVYNGKSWCLQDL